MKSMKLIAAAAAAAAFAQPAFAQSTVSYTVNAVVDKACGVFSFGGDSLTVDLGNLSNVDVSGVSESARGSFVDGEGNTITAGSLSYICNSPEGFTRTISSTNGGVLVNTTAGLEDANEIAYTISHGGGSDLEIDKGSLTSDIVTEIDGSPAFVNGQTGSVTFEATGIFQSGSPVDNEGDRINVFAGDYTDTIIVTVTAR